MSFLSVIHKQVARLELIYQFFQNVLEIQNLVLSYWGSCEVVKNNTLMYIKIAFAGYENTPRMCLP